MLKFFDSHRENANCFQLFRKTLFFSLPTWAEQVMNNETKTIDAMKKSRSGFLLKEILDRFLRKLQSTLAVDPSL